ncbi:hypothetical protein B0H99_103157 [Planomicrobium soli]|uniref:RNA polymerase alpha subunit n=1 Tax=Planomicrobium soli TaxID=1176648 RepID=A0A2P8H496_9BACL|nr:hypothetical protein [Planomicrobium soli]PSL41023.1 hypothetical protein B0H99_103157 [Planomicrobium soli]
MAGEKVLNGSGEEIQPASSFLSKLGSPARNALIHQEIDSLQKLSMYSEKEILKFHGIGPASLPVLRSWLAKEGLSFRKD